MKKISLLALIIFCSISIRAETNISYFLDIQNISGGLESGLATQGNLFLGYEDSTEKDNWSASIIATHGSSPSKLVGDAQTTSNLDIGGVETVKVFELFYQRRWNRLKILAGMFDLASEFNVNSPAALFIHSSPGTSAELAAAGRFGTAFNPYSALGTRLHYDLSKKAYVKSAIMDATPFNPQDPFGTQFTISSEEGLFHITELAYKENGRFKLGLGAWGFLELKGHGFYIIGDYKFSSTFHPFARYGRAFENAQLFKSNIVLGFKSLNWGAMFSRAHFSDRSGASGPEDAYEISYQLNPSGYVIQPNIQYIKEPSGNPAIDDALVIGLRLALSFSSIFET